MAIVDDLKALIGDAGVLGPDDLAKRPAGFLRPDRQSGLALARPTNTDEVAKVMRYAAAHKLPVVTHGGLTGLARGADTSADCLVLSMERMRAIEVIDEVQRTATVQAGVTLQALQEAVEAHDLVFPLDLGARGSATIGGNAAVNAGGNRVLRYGMTREMILGIEAVLADGTVVSSLNTLTKNNTGYDLKQLFIGSEGTLGVITRLVLKLRQKPHSQDVALIAVPDFNAVVKLLGHMDRALSGALSAFEVMWPSFYTLVTTPPGARPPVAQGHPFYVLVEAQGNAVEQDAIRFETAIAAAGEAGLLIDAAIARSQAERNTFWQIRESVAFVMMGGMPAIYDISLPIAHMEAYTKGLADELPDAIGPHKLWIFGHLGDGNLHVVVQVAPADYERLKGVIDEIVYSPLAAIGGSVSAEHGIGFEKKKWLPVSRNSAEIALMRTIKAALDPENRLNPGKIF